MLKYKSYKDFTWEPYYPNDIQENSQNGWICTIEPRPNEFRSYKIEFQLPIDENCLTLIDEPPELYILFGCPHNGPEVFIRAFATLEEAKKRACLQYAHIYGYVMSFIEQGENGNL